MVQPVNLNETLKWGELVGGSEIPIHRVAADSPCEVVGISRSEGRLFLDVATLTGIVTVSADSVRLADDGDASRVGTDQ